MFLKLKIYIYNLLFIRLQLWLLLHFNPLIKAQIKNTAKIPIIIINFNQLFYLKKLVNFLADRNFENIIIIDNKSTYPPLLEYYKKLPANVIVEFMPENYGHMVFFKREELQKKYGQGFYVLTDADIVPNNNLPEDFLKQMMLHLKKNWELITKVGFALKITDIPESNKVKDKIVNWEERFWKREIVNQVFEANIDTTFALYKPGYRPSGPHLSFLRAHRFGGEFLAIHGGWYINQENLNAEQKYYLEHSNSSASWKSDEKGEIKSNHYKKHY